MGSGSIILTLQGEKTELKSAVEWLKHVHSFKVEGFQKLVHKASEAGHEIEEIQDQLRSKQSTATWIYVIAITVPLLIICLSGIFVYVRYYSNPNETIDCRIPEENNPKDLEDGVTLQTYPKLVTAENSDYSDTNDQQFEDEHYSGSM